VEKNKLLADLQQATLKNQHAVVDMLAIHAIENYPNEAFGYYYQSMGRVQRGNYIDAEESLKKAVGLEPNHIDALLLRCTIYRAQENIELWEETINLLLELNGENTDVQLWAARYYLYNFENETALRYINYALVKEPNEAGYKVRAEIYQNTAQYELALEDLEMCQRYSPSNLLIIRQKIAINTLLKDNPAIEADYRRLVSLDPTDMNNKESFAYFLSRANLNKDAEAYWDELVAFNLENPDYSAERAAVRWRLERYEDALEDCESALMYEPKRADFHILLAKIRLSMYDTNEAIQGLDEAIKKGVDNMPKLHQFRGEVLMSESDYIRAAEDFKISSLSADYAGKGFFNLGKCYLEQEALDLAFESWKAADAAFYPDADEMINTYCATQIASQAKSTEAGLIFMYETEAESNQNSRFIKMLSGKVWKFNEETTAKNNPIFKELPQEMQEPLLEAFNKMVLTISASGIFIMNPDQTDMRSVYRIEKEEAAEIWLMSQPLTGASERLLKIGYADKSLSLDGFAEDMEFKLYFRPSPSGLTDKEKKAYEKRKEAGEVAFMGVAIGE
jgi:tetratricopeptide (TPR) repeat protein